MVGQTWSNFVKLGQTCLKLVLFGMGRYNLPPLKKNFVHEIHTCVMEEMRVLLLLSEGQHKYHQQKSYVRGIPLGSTKTHICCTWHTTGAVLKSTTPNLNVSHAPTSFSSTPRYRKRGKSISHSGGRPGISSRNTSRKSLTTSTPSNLTSLLRVSIT